MDKTGQQYPKGTRPHGNHIQIRFRLKGEENYTCKTFKWKPSPANLARAGKLRQNILDEIRHDTFKFVNYFPDDIRAKQINHYSFFIYAQRWLDSPTNDWRSGTRRKYLGILNNIWIPKLHDTPINKIKYSHLADILTSAIDSFTDRKEKPPSPVTYNDWLACIRGVFNQAILDGAVKRRDNPATEFKNKTRIKTEPDPFLDDEKEAIIRHIYIKHDDFWGAWFELGFFTGMRYPSEPSALMWQDIDPKLNEAQIKRRKVRGEILNTTKTNVVRTIYINSRSRHALQKIRPITALQNEYVFAIKGQPIKTGKTPRRIWRQTLTELKIRYRDPYTMRHTFASWGLSNGLSPGWLAQQLGHSLQEFFKTYAKWINKQNDQLQINLLEKSLKVGQKLDKKTN